MAVLIGGIVEIATVLPNFDDLPKRSGDVRVRWDTSTNWKSKALVALAGPAAEMVFREEPLHPGFIAEWAEDWAIAWDYSKIASTNEKNRLALLEQIAIELYHTFRRDEIWNAVAALADELLAHETLYQAEIEETIRFWIG